MSDPVTAVKNARYTAGIAEITEIGPMGMITLRGDLGAAHIRKAATAVGGGNFPDQRMVSEKGDSALAWMSPDEVLIMVPYDRVQDTLDRIAGEIGTAHHLAVNVSDARAVFDVSGPNAREVMAKLAPVDLSTEAFSPGMFRRTRMAQVPAAFWMRDETTFRVICFRSVGQYMFDLLSIAAQPGSEVGAFA